MEYDELTPEEAEALKVMESDTGTEDISAKESTDTTEAEETSTEEVTGDDDDKSVTGDHTDAKPEFKSQRAEADKDDAKPPEGFVPHGAMHAERQKRQAAEANLSTLEKRLEALEKPAEVDVPPQYVDPLEDPEGFRKWSEHTKRDTAAQIEAIQTEHREQAKHSERAQEAAQFEQEFAAKTPDYGDAVQALHNSRVNELRMQGYGDAEISAQISKDAGAVFDAAKQIGMNPAELLYIRAQQAGYQPASSPVPTNTDAEKITALAEAQKKTQGAGSSGGVAQSGQLTAERLANMSEDELAKVPDSELQRVMGG